MSDSMDDINDEFAEGPPETDSDLLISPILITEDRVRALLTKETCRFGAGENVSRKCQRTCSGACTLAGVTDREKKNRCADRTIEHDKERGQRGQ